MEAAVAYVKQREDVDPIRIGALGFSMSAAAFLLTRSSGIRAIVTDSSYASPEELIGRQFFFLPAPLNRPFVTLTNLWAHLLLDVDVSQAAPREVVRMLHIPLLLIHGDADFQIPVSHTRQIAANADPSVTELWIVPGAGHGSAHAQEGAPMKPASCSFSSGTSPTKHNVPRSHRDAMALDTRLHK